MKLYTNNNNLFWVPVFLILYNFCANLANDIYLPSLPTLQHVFSTSSLLLQWTMTAWFLGVALPQLIFGPLSDRFGRRPILFAGAFCFLISTVICGMANNVYILIAARFFQGVGVCSLNVATFAILIDLYNYYDRTKLMTKITMIGTLAPLIGPVLGGYVLTYFGWRMNFCVIFVMGFVSIVGLWFKLPESNLNLNPSAMVLKNLVFNYYQLFLSKDFLRHLLPACLLLGGLIVYLTSAPFIIIDKLNVLPHLFGFTQLPIFGAYMLGSIYLGKIKSEEKVRRALTWGLAMVFVAVFFLLMSSYFFEANLSLFILPMIIYALGYSLCGPTLMSEAMSSASAAKGSAAAFIGFGMAVSCMLSSLCLGLIYNGTIFVVAVLMFSIVILAASVYFIRVRSWAIENSVSE